MASRLGHTNKASAIKCQFTSRKLLQLSWKSFLQQCRHKQACKHVQSAIKCQLVHLIIISSHFIHPLTARVAGAPQMILQPISSIYFYPVLHCLLEPAEFQACPFPDVVFPPLPLSALFSSPFHCALQDGFGQT